MDDLALQPPKQQVGADTISRFRYQSAVGAYLALLACSSESHAQFPSVDAVYCEHHEDILIRTQTGSYIAVQVKTRGRRRPQFKAHDESVVGALKAFGHLREQHGNQIVGYRLITNHGFATTKTSTDLLHVLNLCKKEKSDRDKVSAAGPFPALPSEIDKLIRKIKAKPKKAKKSEGSGQSVDKTDGDDVTEYDIENLQIDLSRVADERIFALLLEVQIFDSWPNLDDLDDKLAIMISSNSEVGPFSTSDARRISKRLIMEVMDSSRLRHDTLKYIICTNPTEQNLLDCEAQKRWDRDRVKASIQAHSISLPLQVSKPFSNVSKDTHRLILKAQAGGLEEEEIENARDLCSSAQALILSWRAKYPEKTCNEKLGHLKALVREACLAEHGRFSKATESYGAEQLTAIRERLQKLHETEGLKNQLYTEHLIGFAWILTEECTLWWSKKFDL